MSGPGSELTARAELAERCRSCGTCRSVCPVFAEVRREDAVARGKVALIQSVLEGELDLSEIFEDRVLLCLNCKSCVANCPNSVRVDDLILAARHDLVESGRLPLVRRLIFRLLLKRGRLLPPVGRLASFAQRWLLRGLPEGSPMRLLLPLAGVDEHRVFPQFAPRSFVADAPRVANAETGSTAEPSGPRSIAAEARPDTKHERGAAGTDDEATVGLPPGEARVSSERTRLAREVRSVAFFVGCATNLIYPESGRAIVDALTRSGVDVIIPRGQTCCGTPVFNSGDFETARAMARRNIRLLRGTGADAVVTGCGSCGLTLKREYEETLGLEGGVGLPVFDFAEFLAHRTLVTEGSAQAAPSREAADAGSGGRVSQGLESVEETDTAAQQVGAADASRRVRVTFHDPCHLGRGQEVYEEPRALLRSLPSIEFVEMRDADRCCGGGGTFSLSHYDISKAIGAHKVAAIRDAEVDIVATECPACVMQLQDMLAQAGLDVAVMSVADVIALGRGAQSRG